MQNNYIINTQKSGIKTAVHYTLSVRAQFPDSLLADLYDPLAMPPILAKAHTTLDRAVDKLYSRTPFTSDAERVTLLFKKYQEVTP